MDSSFDYVPSAVQLKEKGLFYTTVMKTKRNWPKYTKANEAITKMDRQEVVAIQVCKGKYSGSEGASSKEGKKD